MNKKENESFRLQIEQAKLKKAQIENNLKQIAIKKANLEKTEAAQIEKLRKLNFFLETNAHRVYTKTDQ